MCLANLPKIASPTRTGDPRPRTASGPAAQERSPPCGPAPSVEAPPPSSRRLAISTPDTAPRRERRAVTAANTATVCCSRVADCLLFSCGTVLQGRPVAGSQPGTSPRPTSAGTRGGTGTAGRPGRRGGAPSSETRAETGPAVQPNLKDEHQKRDRRRESGSPSGPSPAAALPAARSASLLHFPTASVFRAAVAQRARLAGLRTESNSDRAKSSRYWAGVTCSTAVRFGIHLEKRHPGQVRITRDIPV